VDQGLPDFLFALQGPLLNVAVGVVLSFIQEYIPAFCGLDPKAKRLVTGALCLAIPLLACLVSTLLGYQINSLEYGWWPAIVAGAIAFSSATLAHTRKLLASAVAAPGRWQ
jgi:hypothetical protein